MSTPAEIREIKPFNCQVGDLIQTQPDHFTDAQERAWIGLVVDTSDPHCFRVFVLRNDEYPDQVGYVSEWTRYEEWIKYDPELDVIRKSDKTDL